MEVEVDGTPVPNKPMVSVNVKQHFNIIPGATQDQRAHSREIAFERSREPTHSFAGYSCTILTNLMFLNPLPALVTY